MRHRRFVITGPESTGKSTLTEELGKRLMLETCPEMAVSYLENLNREYTESDLTAIADLQESSIQEKLKEGDLLSDTDALTLFIWSMEKFGRVDNRILGLLEQNQPDAYLLCFPDLPWEPHPLREHPNKLDRIRFFRQHQEIIQSLGTPFAIIRGLKEERFQRGMKFLEARLAALS